VSACLLGVNCRYDGKNKKSRSLLKRLEFKEILPICPEQLGGLPTPRPASRIVRGDGFDVLNGNAKVINILGTDNTKAFIDGAYTVLDILKINNITSCYLKNKSPSCGIGTTKLSIFQRYLFPIKKHIIGVLAALLIREGYQVEEITVR
jgi:uncharacterized protein YbbK (DUF523 family)